MPGEDEEKAFENLRETLNVAAEKGLSINWEKCKFLKRQVEHLEYIIEDGHVRPCRKTEDSRKVSEA